LSADISHAAITLTVNCLLSSLSPTYLNPLILPIIWQWQTAVKIFL